MSSKLNTRMTRRALVLGAVATGLAELLEGALVMGTDVATEPDVGVLLG